MGRVLRGARARRGLKRIETLLRRLPGQMWKVGSQVVGVSLARCTHLVKKTFTEVKKWHRKLSYPCDCLSIAPRCIGIGQEHLVIGHGPCTRNSGPISSQGTKCQSCVRIHEILSCLMKVPLTMCCTTLLNPCAYIFTRTPWRCSWSPMTRSSNNGAKINSSRQHVQWGPSFPIVWLKILMLCLGDTRT